MYVDIGCSAQLCDFDHTEKKQPLLNWSSYGSVGSFVSFFNEFFFFKAFEMEFSSKEEKNHIIVGFFVLFVLNILYGFEIIQ